VRYTTQWPCPLPGGGHAAHFALGFDGARGRVLVVPALFDEANKLRHFTVEVMDRLAGAGIGSVLPDLPGCGESLAALDTQTPGDWALAMQGAARHFACTHVLAIRGGALVAPADRPAWHYAPVAGASLLRQMLRARILSLREAGLEETQDSLLAKGREAGLELAGYALSPEFLSEFGGLVPVAGAVPITQDMLGGPGRWLRAEPAFDPAQADALAAAIAVGIAQ